MNKLKVLILANNIFGEGGIQRVVSVVANELSKKYEVEILCRNDSFKIDRTKYGLRNEVMVDLRSVNEKKIIKKYIYGGLRRLNNKTGILNKRRLNFLVKEICISEEVRDIVSNIINEKKPDLVIGCDGTNTVLLASIKNNIKCKIVGWQHNSYEAYFETKNRYFYNQINLFEEYLKNLDEVIVLTEQDKKEYKEKMNIDAKVIYNPLSFRAKEKSSVNNKNILFVGRLVEEQKGLDYLVDVAKKVFKKHDDWRLIIVGSGPDRDKLVSRIKKNNLENNIIIEEFTSNIQDFYLKSSIFLSTSRWEGFGLVVTEAMEYGVPVIAFNNSGPKEIIDNEINGILVECGNINMMAEKVMELIRNEKKRKKIGQEAIKKANKFDCEIIAKEWEKIFN